MRTATAIGKPDGRRYRAGEDGLESIRMVTMSAVWDRTTGFLGDHAGAVVTIAALGLFVPVTIIQLLQPALAGAAGGNSLVPTLLWLVLMAISFLGRLAMIALVLNASGKTFAAWRTGVARLLPAFALVVIVCTVFVLISLPVTLILAAHGVDLAAIENGGTPTLSAGSAWLIGIYVLVVGAFGIWLYARLLPIWPVVVAERLGLRSFARAFHLSRGFALRILGVSLLFGIVGTVAAMAAKTVTGSIARLILGSQGGLDAATIITALAGSLVSTTAWVVTVTFATELYLALRDRAETAAA